VLVPPLLSYFSIHEFLVDKSILVKKALWAPVKVWATKTFRNIREKSPFVKQLPFMLWHKIKTLRRTTPEIPVESIYKIFILQKQDFPVGF